MRFFTFSAALVFGLATSTSLPSSSDASTLVQVDSSHFDDALFNSCSFAQTLASKGDKDDDVAASPSPAANDVKAASANGDGAKAATQPPAPAAPAKQNKAAAVAAAPKALVTDKARVGNLVKLRRILAVLKDLLTQNATAIEESRGFERELYLGAVRPQTIGLIFYNYLVDYPEMSDVNIKDNKWLQEQKQARYVGYSTDDGGNETYDREKRVDDLRADVKFIEDTIAVLPIRANQEVTTEVETQVLATVKLLIARKQYIKGAHSDALQNCLENGMTPIRQTGEACYQCN